MTENIRLEDSSPLATVEDIQKRLLRPASLHSPPYFLLPLCLSKADLNFPFDLIAKFPSSFFAGKVSNSLALKVNSKQSGRTVKKRLEDYLDPVILAAISSKISRSKKVKLETKFKGFEWPVDELKVFVEEDSRNSNGGSWRNKAIDLNDDFDVLRDGSDGDEEIGSPFQRVGKKTALKKFEH
ncbi:hypothetical protein GOBAR_AA40090 [Gossypium barbadense]|uniref:Uncharacterized protein n=1 Tax=Gossypium barbadense TaxID=3634 RepID=A0A2P5VP67_GOSBA|nr:hypothetical protein GOBAR_AA40090 [Gossypium barbadense]